MRKLALFLVLIMIIAVIASCGNEGAGIQQTTTKADTVLDDTETTAQLTDGLPDVDMDGFALRILHSTPEAMSWVYLTLDVDQQSGDLIDDEIFIRNSQIEERFNSEIQISEMDRNGIVTTLKNIVTSGDDAYDVVMLYNIAIIDNVTYLADWNDVEYLNLDAQWWNPDASNVFNVGGIQYAIAGNFSLNVHSIIACLAFNKTMYENLQIKENLYALANEGKWTVDVLYSTAKNGIRDINGDGTFDENDNFGIYGSVKHVYNTLLLGSEVKYTTKDSEGFPVFSLPDDESALSKMMHIIELAMSDNYFLVVAADVHTGTPENFFANGHSLFATVSINDITKLRDMEDDIGILPAPKYNESQQQYHAPAYGAELSMLPLSYSVDRIDNIGIMLEALSFYSDQKILPIYKEVLLKTKSSRDIESEAMLDIIFSNVIFEFGINAWQDYLATPMMNNIFFKINNNVVSALDTIRPVLEGKSNSLRELVQSLG